MIRCHMISSAAVNRNLIELPFKEYGGVLVVEGGS